MAYPLFGTTATQVAAWYAVLGSERTQRYLRDLKANGLMIVDGNAMTRDLVARGEVPIGFTVGAAALLSAADAAGETAPLRLVADQWRLLATSLLLALWAAGLALALGMPYALLCERVRFPGRRLFAVVYLLPLLIPPHTHAIVSGRLLAARAPVNTWLMETLGLDGPALSLPLLALVRGLCDELGTTVLHVTHDLDEALILADRLFLMRQGRLLGERVDHDLSGLTREALLTWYRDTLAVAGKCASGC
jgi:ABC-type sugar transport system permease subunit